MSNQKLSYKEEGFCREYISNRGNGRQAYMTMYSPKNLNVAGVEACKLLKKPHIQRRIKELTESKEKQRVYDREENIMFLLSVRDNTEEKTADRVKAAIELARMNGEYIQRIETKSDDEIKLDQSTIKALLEGQK